MKVFSNWRVVAHAYYGSQHHLYMDESMEDVKNKYQNAFYEVLTTDEQMAINKITLEKWNGKPKSGNWMLQDLLKVPKPQRTVEGA